MQKRLYTTLIAVIISMVAAFAAPRQFTLVIDAGHGGNDAGAVGAFSKEKDINLRTALAFGRYVEKNCPDVRVIYTRKTDVFVTLHGRADIANKAKADLFISIHTNAVPASAGKTARGLETYTLGMHRAGDNLDIAKRENSVILIEKDYRERYQGFDPNSSESYIIFEFMQDNNMQRSVDLAKLVQSNVCSTANRPNKGVKQAGFLVLRETSMPSCLIELGFISTPSEEQLLNNEASIDQIARGIYQAFVSYKAKVQGNPAPMFEEIKQTPKDEKAEKKEEKAEKKNEKAEKKKEGNGEEKKMPQDVKHAKTKAEKTPEAEEEKKEDRKEEPKNEESAEKNNDVPVFKVQVFVAERVLKATDARFKGEKNAKYYKEAGMVKYTIGETTNYNEALRIRKSLLEKFPDCFIIAFKNGEKMNINNAIKEFKARR